jgi:hypothetical protein
MFNSVGRRSPEGLFISVKSVKDIQEKGAEKSRKTMSNGLETNDMF